MITILNGKLTVPENERFIGFAGDNLNKTIEFLLSDEDKPYRIYRLYLAFDDGTVNYFTLPSKLSDEGVVLTWNVLTEHIFKSGLVSAQIKAFSENGVIYHTTTDTFLVGNSSEFSEDFKSENSEFLRYERRLNELIDDVGDVALMMPYIGDNGNWFVFQADAGKYVDSGKPSMGQADSLMIADGSITPLKLDRAYWEKNTINVYSFAGMDNLINSRAGVSTVVHYVPDPDMFEAVRLTERNFIVTASGDSTLTLLDTVTGVCYGYTLGKKSFERLSDSSVVFAGMFNTMEELQSFDFEENLLYSFCTAGALGSYMDSGYCIGTCHMEFDLSDNLYARLRFANYSTGSCYTLNLATGECEKTSPSLRVDSALDAESSNPVSNQAVAEAINTINSTLNGVEELIAGI